MKLAAGRYLIGKHALNIAESPDFGITFVNPQQDDPFSC